VSAIDPIRAAAFDEILQLPEAREHAGSDAAGAIEAIPAEHRARALHIASRRLAFQILFEMDARGISDPAFASNTLAYVDGLTPLQAEQIAALIAGAHEHRAKADAVFRELAPEWPTHRLAGTDRAILRLAYHEIASGTTPAPVVINEAVELARHYSTDRSPAFINALLDKAAKNLNAPTTPA